MYRVGSERASLPVKSSPPFDVNALLRRFSAPSQSTDSESATDQSTAQLPAGSSSQEHGILSVSKIPFHTVHKYALTSRGREYATIVVVSRAPNIQDSPLLHFGDDLNGLILLPKDNISDMRSMEVVFQLFESDPITPSYETKRVLPSQQVDESCISGGQFIWPFVFSPPPVLSSSSGSTAASNPADSSDGHILPRGDSIKSKVQLIITIYRRGRLTRNVGLRQPIRYIPPPERVMTPSYSMGSTELPSASVETPSLPADSPWPHQTFPRVVVRGVMFREIPVEVECKLIVPVSYPASDVIPLRLVTTSENRQELDLFSQPHAIDVRLLKVMAFGENSGNIHPFTLRDRRSSYHRTNWAAKAQWEVDGDAWELPPSEEHPRSRWRIKLNGKFHRDQSVEMTESFEQKGMAIMYFVCLFPFRSTQFRPTSDPNKELFMGKLPITRQR